MALALATFSCRSFCRSHNGITLSKNERSSKIYSSYWRSPISHVSSVNAVLDTVVRKFSSTKAASAEKEVDAISGDESLSITKEGKEKAAAEFLKRREVYRRQVSRLRKTYATEVARLRAVDEAEERARKTAIKRAKLEQQRVKNIRTAQSALKQKERQDQRRKEFEEELRIAQINRDARNALFNKARQLVIDELEEQAHLWLTTPEEVKAAFTHEASQLLWTFPGGVIGSPRPNDDSEFWKYECHTWHMDKTYPQRQDILLKQLLEEVYDATNIDMSFWTPERIDGRVALEEKARLRAMVRLRGLAILLQKRGEIFKERFIPKRGEIPREAPIPDLRVFVNTEAMEREGVRDLLENPQAFFHFENDDDDEDTDTVTDDKETYSGPTLGAPILLRDWIRDDGGPFPIIVGDIPEISAKSEKEKKRLDREAKMRAAANADMTEEERQDAEIRAELEDEDEEEWDPVLIDFNNIELDDEEMEWREGLDPVEDFGLVNLPKPMRYTEEDVEWVIKQLEREQKNLAIMIQQKEDAIRYMQKAAEEKQRIKMAQWGPSAALKQFEIDPSRVQKLLFTLNDEQNTFLRTMGLTENMTEAEIRDAYRKVPGLSDEQYSELVELDILYLQQKRKKKTQ